MAGCSACHVGARSRMPLVRDPGHGGPCDSTLFTRRWISLGQLRTALATPVLRETGHGGDLARSPKLFSVLAASRAAPGLEPGCSGRSRYRRSRSELRHDTVRVRVVLFGGRLVVPPTRTAVAGGDSLVAAGALALESIHLRLPSDLADCSACPVERVWENHRGPTGLAAFSLLRRAGVAGVRAARPWPGASTVCVGFNVSPGWFSGLPTACPG